MSIILQQGNNLPSEKKDVIMKMNFNITQHVVKAYNRVWVSSRALELKGLGHGTFEETGDWLNIIYREYCTLRTVCIKDPDTVTRNDMVALMQAYCGYLRKNDTVQDYWITLDCPQIKERIDSKSMHL